MSFRFGDCVVDPERFALSRNSRTVKLEPKVFDVLLYLIEHRSRVVTKRELLDTLWPGEAVSDSVLPRCIAAARRAIGDARERQAVIATVHGRGYQFVAGLEESAKDTTNSSAPHPTRPSAPGEVESAFVGRVAALERLDELIIATEGSDGAVALIVGEPGIGKTRLAEEVVAHARARGFEVLAGRCDEGEGVPGYWPWIQILRDAIAATPDDGTLRAQLGGVAAAVAELIPEIQGRITDLPALAAGGDNQARFRLYDAIARFLTTRASDRPLLLLLDDLHWADASSLGLLRFLARHAGDARILMVGTYRDAGVRRGHPLVDILGALAREARCERVPLTGLDESEVSTFVARLTGVEPNAPLLARIREMTEGNPFFVREIVRLLVESDPCQTSDEMSDALALPQGIRDAIGRRLDKLSPDCNDVLHRAAVLGRNFRLPRLESMYSGDVLPERDVLIELLAEALDSGIIVETSRGHYSFGHALTRQTLYEELRSPQRIALHRSAGLAIELEGVTGDPECKAELAHHFFEAAPGGDVDKAVAYAVAAAESSHRAHAYDEAVEFYQRALEASQLATPIDRMRRAELMLALGQAQFVAGARDRALPTLLAAADLARPLERSDLMALAAIAIRGFGEMGTPPDPRVLDLLRECLVRLPVEEQSLRASLLSRLNGAAAMSLGERYELARQAVEIAERCGDPVALHDAYGSQWWATLGPDRLDERDALGRKLRALFEQTRDPRSRLQALECEIGVALLRGDRATTERSLDEFDRVANELRQPAFIFMGMNHRTSWLISRGRYDEAARQVENARKLGTGILPYAEAVCSGQTYWAHSVRGMRRDLDFRFLDHVLAETFTLRSVSRLFMASLHYSADGDGARAIAMVDGIDLKSIERDENWLMALSTLSWLSVDVGRTDLIEWLYRTLQPYASLIAVHDLLRAGFCSVTSLLGILASALSELDAAVGFFEEAIARERGADLVPGLAGSQAGLACALRIRRSPGDRARADELAWESTATCDALGLGPFARPRILLERFRGI